MSFVILGGLMVVGTLLQLVQLYASHTLKLVPVTDVLGMWLGVVGTILVAWGAAEVLNEETAARSSEGPRQMTTFSRVADGSHRAPGTKEDQVHARDHVPRRCTDGDRQQVPAGPRTAPR